MSAPVETMACTMPVSIILEMTLPILAMVMAPESVSTTLQSGSFTMASVDVEGLAQAAPAEGGLGHRRAAGRRRSDLVEVEALERRPGRRDVRRGTRGACVMRDLRDRRPIRSGAYNRRDARATDLRRRLDALYRALRPPVRGPRPAAVRAPRSARTPTARWWASSPRRWPTATCGRSSAASAAVLEALGAAARGRGATGSSRARWPRRLPGFKHRFNDGRDVACLLFFVAPDARAARLGGGASSAPGHAPRRARRRAPRWPRSPRATLALDHGGLYGRGALPARRGRALLLPVARGRERLQAAEPVPALDGAPRRRGPRRVARRGPAPRS